MRKLGLEGVVGKRIDSTYEPGERSGAWLKLRVNLEQEFVIGGYTPGAHGFDALLVGVYEKRELMLVAKVKNGFVPRIRDEFFQALKACKLPSVPSRICPNTEGQYHQQQLEMNIDLPRRAAGPRPSLVRAGSSELCPYLFSLDSV